jgi:hypothetical protein
MAWTGTAHGLIGELGVGTVTHTTLQMGLGMAGLLAGIGGTLILAGLGLVWVGRAATVRSGAEGEVETPRQEPITV